jgi:hypothetical protein
VLAIVIAVPWSHRSFALPVLLRLYRNEKDREKAGVPHKTKTALGREMIDVVCRWLDKAPRGILLAIDSGYANRTVMVDHASALNCGELSRSGKFGTVHNGV